jgi:SAM-dependent methyltransferase
MSGPLEFTGERFTPECVREIWYEHYHRYVFAASLVSGRRVLDAACGEGYGSELLARSALNVTGVDISAETIAHARARYHAPNLSFEQADCCSLPFPDGSFDCVVSFETLEHLENQSELVEEFRRVLTPAGFLVISSPDKAVYSDQNGTENDFHVRELYRQELDELLQQQFPVRRLLGQKLMFHSAIWPLNPEQSEDRFEIRQFDGDEVRRLRGPGHEAVYLIALCAGSVDCLPALDRGLCLFDDASDSVYAHYHHEIRKNMAAGGILAEYEQEIAQLRAAQAARRPWWRRWFPGKKPQR